MQSKSESAPGQGRVPSLNEIVFVLILGLPLVVTVAVISAANWVDGLPPLILLALAPLPFWTLMARSRISWRWGHPLGVLISVLGAIIIGAFTISEAGSLTDLFTEIGGWFGAIGSTAGDRGEVTTGTFLIGIVLFCGHLTTWSTFRAKAPVVHILPGLAALLVVLTFLPSSFYWYFFLYALVSAPGIALKHMRSRKEVTGLQTAGVVVVSAAVMGVALIPVWQAPAPEGIVIPAARQFEEPLYKFQSGWASLFYGVPDRKNYIFYSPPLDLDQIGPFAPRADLPFKEVKELSEQEIFLVESQQAYHWRMRTYETYTSEGWTSSDNLLEVQESDVHLEENTEGLRDTKQVDITVRIFSKTNTLVTVGEPIGSNIPTEVELTGQDPFKLFITSPQTSYLPDDVTAYRNELVSWIDSRIDGTSQMLRASDAQVLPEDETLSNPGIVYAEVEDDFPSGDFIGVQRQEPDPHQPMALLSGRGVLNPPVRYSTSGVVSTASSTALRGAGADYPVWVTDRYLQLPDTLPDRVKRLAETMTESADNPYDKAQAMQAYLHRLPYTLDVTLPPEGQDFVDFFLFELGRGFCQNYASSMATMLRSLGIPARLVVGFGPGEYDEDRGGWVVRARHYHAWTEVYFPEYGWVEFEPTPADVQDSLVSLGFTPGAGRLATGGVAADACEEFIPGICDDEALDSGDDLFNELDDLDALNDLPPDAQAQTGGGVSALTAFIATVVALAVVLPVGGIVYARWNLSRMPYVTSVYASMRILASMAGIGPKPQETPWEYNRRLAQAIPERTDDLSYITARYVKDVYGDPGGAERLTGQDMHPVKQSWKSVRNGLLKQMILRLVPERFRGDPDLS